MSGSFHCWPPFDDRQRRRMGVEWKEPCEMLSSIVGGTRIAYEIGLDEARERTDREANSPLLRNAIKVDEEAHPV